MALNVITREQNKVAAYEDAATHYITKGPDSQGRPYGIIDDDKTDPFGLVFDETAVTVTINPGTAHIYGRQVELTEAELVYDFHSSVESANSYCVVYLEVNLADQVSQLARIRIVMTGANYENESNNSQQNLLIRKNGVYWAPINHFIYRPNETPHFTDYGFYMEVLPNESRYATDTLRYTDTICGKEVQSIAELYYGDEGYASLRWNIEADNSESLEVYDSLANPTESSPGYSLADEMEAIGIGENAVTIDEDELSNLITIDRVKVCDVTTDFGRPSGNFSITHKIDWAHIKEIRVWFAHLSGIVCTLAYHEGSLIFDFSDSPSENFMSCPLLYSGRQDWVFDSSTLPTTQEAILYLEGAFTSRGLGQMEVELYLTPTKLSEYDQYMPVSGTSALTSGYHIYGTLTIKGNTISMTNVGDQYFRPSLTSYVYRELNVTEGQGQMFIDFIYKGGVDLS